MKARIAIVEDHSFYRHGLSLAIKRLNFAEISYEAANGIEFIEKQRLNPADVVLMDIKMPVMDGLQAVKEAKKHFPELKIIILTMIEEEEWIEQLVEAGVHGYLLKNIDNNGLEIALKAVINGRHYFSEELMSFFSRKLQEKNIQPGRIVLTKRESEILQLLYDGFSNQEIADKLYVSVRTIVNHRSNLKAKASAKNTAGLIAFGIKNNYINR